GQQPMIDASGRYVVAFNGEIWNFRHLRGELQTLGFEFRTRSDTEVVLHGFAAWGSELPKRLDGQFALAACDTRDATYLFARDQ
ncbi:asparagine synthetase B, partial [Enterobacter hormaechei]|nr:asparagine synthetase B [Enterobacter hormaechei]